MKLNLWMIYTFFRSVQRDSSFIPIPVSLTQTSIIFISSYKKLDCTSSNIPIIESLYFFFYTIILMPPLKVNRMAFPIRFNNTWHNLYRSPKMIYEISGKSTSIFSYFLSIWSFNKSTHSHMAELISNLSFFISNRSSRISR